MHSQQRMLCRGIQPARRLRRLSATLNPRVSISYLLSFHPVTRSTALLIEARTRPQPRVDVCPALHREYHCGEIEALSPTRRVTVPARSSLNPGRFSKSGSLNSLRFAFWPYPAAFGQQDAPVSRGSPEGFSAPPWTLLPKPSPRVCMLGPALV